MRTVSSGGDTEREETTPKEASRYPKPDAMSLEVVPKLRCPHARDPSPCRYPCTNDMRSVSFIRNTRSGIRFVGAVVPSSKPNSFCQVRATTRFTSLRSWIRPRHMAGFGAWPKRPSIWVESSGTRGSFRLPMANRTPLSAEHDPSAR